MHVFINQQIIIHSNHNELPAYTFMETNDPKKYRCKL